MKLKQPVRRFLSRRSSLKTFAAGALSVLCISLFIQDKPKDSYFEVSKNLDIYATLFKELNTYYVDPIEPGRLSKVAINAMLDNLDPYTNYYTESDIEEYEFMTTGRYGGIGATIRPKDDNFYVGDVYEGSPAMKAGLRPGDLIITIDGHPLKGHTMEDASQLLKGSTGTQVVIRVKDAYNGQDVDKPVMRGEIELSSVPYAGLVGANNDVAFVRLTQFTQACARQVREALDSLKVVQPALSGVVIDLRNNPGGLLDQAVDMCNLFTDRGQLVVSTKGKNTDWDKEYKTSGPAWDTKLPLAVLINHSSASASEIVSGTMQDIDRGVIIGEKSYGKGLVQTTRPLGYNARLKLTTARYYTPSGRCIQVIDYAHRNADGSVGSVPDSLKKSYKTSDGRTVRSGGGIEPDVSLKKVPVSKLGTALYTRNYLFDWATQYAKSHASIAPAKSFTLTPAEWDAFVTWLSGKDYAYKTTTEEAIDSAESTAKREQYYDAAKVEFAALRAKVGHDKKADLIKNKTEVQRMLESEIVSRYYYLRGRIAHSLRNDDDLAKALSILADKPRYNAILAGKK